jgi:hypothetical protein
MLAELGRYGGQQGSRPPLPFSAVQQRSAAPVRPVAVDWANLVSTNVANYRNRNKEIEKNESHPIRSPR